MTIRFVMALGTLLWMGSRVAHGATIRVPEDYQLIQNAADQATNGDTILLGKLNDSLWVEDVSITGKSLVFKSIDGPRFTQIKRRIAISNLGTSDTTRFIGIRWNTGSSRRPILVEEGYFAVDQCVFDTSNECHVNGNIISVGGNAYVTVTRCTFVAQPYAISSLSSSFVYVSSCLFTRTCGSALNPRGGYLSAQYCCFWNNANDADSSVDWGLGNIPFDPQLRDPDMSLFPGSPCIDAGDPALPHDPDGSRADIGAYIPFQVPHPLYASTSGSDASGDGTLSSPFRTIKYAYFNAIPGDTIILLPGRYEEHVRLTRTPVFLTSQGGPASTTVAGTDTGLHVLEFTLNTQGISTVSGLTIENAHSASGIYVGPGHRLRVENCVFRDIYPIEGAGVDIHSDSVTVYGCLFEDIESAEKGGGVLAGNARGTLVDSCTFRNNRSGDAGAAVVFVTGSKQVSVTRNVVYHNTNNDDYGGPLYMEFTDSAILHNNTIIENLTDNVGVVGAGIVAYNSHSLDIRNNLIFANQGAYGIAMRGGSSDIVCEYNNCFGHWTGEYQGVSPGIGSISEYPLYDTGFYLLPGSPCIDAGDPAMHVPPGGGSIIDIGALEYQQPVSADDPITGTLPDQFSLSPNFPNPFNASTRISYTLPQPGTVTLTIYDVLGRHVQTLVDEVQAVGEHSVMWHGRNGHGQEVASGVYFYKLSVGGETEVRKMVVVK